MVSSLQRLLRALFMPEPVVRHVQMAAVVSLVLGFAALLAADTFDYAPAVTLVVVVAGVAFLAYAAAAALAAFATTRRSINFPDDPPPGERPASVESFACLTPSGVSAADDGVSSSAAIADMLRKDDKKTGRDGRVCGPSFHSDPPQDSPAALAFDGLLLRALQNSGAGVPDIAEFGQSPGCPSDALSDEQLRAFLEAAIGRETVLPSVGTLVPTQVLCVTVRDCRTLSTRLAPPDRPGKQAVRTLVSVEFLVMRDGDRDALHYEAQIATAPLALSWFKRLGRLPSGDASCTPSRRKA